jgi:lipopolysaccharide/colanic/teichoic acid biosynthesis glycosyltransferase
MDTSTARMEAIEAEAGAFPRLALAGAAGGGAVIGLDVDREAFELARSRPWREREGIDWSEVGRRTFDLVLASVLLVLVAPLMLAIAVAVRLDSTGPALFRQRRLGRAAVPFTVLKFRTMHAWADAAVHEEYMRRQISNGEHAAVDENGNAIFKPWPDHRVTRVGRFLRCTSLDELPQLINVLRGEMSLVGYRPPIPYEVECYPAHWYERFAIKPGITGLWQVSGRNQKSYGEMIALDIEYAARRTMWLDVALLVKTVAVVVRRHGAY